MFGRLSVAVEPQVPVTFGGESPPYDLLSVLVSNQARKDAHQTRCEIRWRPSAQGRAFHERTTTGAWLNTYATDMSSFSGAPEESQTLLSNGHPERMALLVKYPGDANAYIATRHNYIATTHSGGPRWVHQNWALQPGAYELNLRFTSSGGVSGDVTFQVWNDGSHGSVRSDLQPFSTAR
jgi:hypothetical protein